MTPKKKRVLTLDKTWRYCLAMWRWIVTQHKNTHEEVWELKGVWLQRHRRSDMPLLEHCYFCAWAELHRQVSYKPGCRCQWCPGAEVEESFHCQTTAYHYSYRPAKFLAKLEELYSKYQTQKKAKRKGKK